MNYQQNIEGCLVGNVGAKGLAQADLDAKIEACLPLIDGLKAKAADNSLPLLRLPAARDDLARLQEIAKAWRDRFQRIVILGIGGSSLGARALLALRDPADTKPEILVLDNLDPDACQPLTQEEQLEDTGFVVISKSGGTAETLSQALIVLKSLQKLVKADALPARLLFIAEPGDNPLRKLAAQFGIGILDHDPLVGGRYSALSLVGLLPALFAGLDVVAFRSGAQEVLQQAFDDPKNAPAVSGAALSVVLAETKQLNQTVLMPYNERLSLLASWYRQLWAESIGKDGHGTTPIDALGPVDQHSQLQLYLDGPNDKLYSIIAIAAAGRGPHIDAELAKGLGQDYLAGRSIGDLVDAMQRATTETLIANGRPTRLLSLRKLDEGSLGALMMHFFLETILACGLVGVDAFDQPAVEQGKVLARKYLQEMA